MSGEWKSGLCTCCSSIGGTPVCCLSFCGFSALLSGSNVQQLGGREECITGGNFAAGVMTHGGGFMFFGILKAAVPPAVTAVVDPAPICLCLWYVVTHCLVRGAIRKKHNIPGHVCLDFLCHCCCLPCSVIQASQCPDFKSLIDCTRDSF